MASTSSTLQELKSDLKQQWFEDLPIALFPVKVQIRFMNCLHVARISRAGQIVDENEVKSLLSPAAQMELNEIVQNLESGSEMPKSVLLPAVALNSSGRLVGGFEPVEDKKELWVRFYPDDVHLQTHEDELTADEHESGRDFWREMNRAAGLEEASARTDHQIGAWRVLTNGYSHSRAAWIAMRTKPSNYKETETILEERLAFPEIPKNAPTSTWNEAPHTLVLPQYFMLRLYGKEKKVINGIEETVEVIKEYMGNPVADYVQLSVDPNAEGPVFQEGDTGLELPEGMKWLVDFEAAVAAGMGIRIPLESKEAETGFDKLIVVGVKPGLNGEAGSVLAEKLFENHRHKPGGMSILQQGTPTNNTEEDNSGRGLDDLDAEESFELVFGNKKPASSDHAEKTDGQRLSEAFGLGEDGFDEVYSNDGQDIGTAIKMNQVLWHGTLGYALPQFFFPLIRQEDVSLACQFMVNYVISRGALPSLRIDDQPYGVIPAVNAKAFLAGEGDEFGLFLQGMNQEVLQKLDGVWTGLVEQVQKLGKDVPESELSKTFYKVLELQANSISYDQQISIGESIADTASSSGQPVSVDTGKPAQLKNKFKEQIGINLNGAAAAFSYLHANVSAPLQANIVDSLPNREEQTIEALDGTEKNYIHWMGSFQTGFDRIKNEDFSNFTEAELTAPPKSLLYNLLRYSLMRHYLEIAIQIKYMGDPVLGEVFKMDFEENLIWLDRDPADANKITGISLNNKFRYILVQFVQQDFVRGLRMEALEKFPGKDQQESRDQYVADKLLEIDLNKYADNRLQEMILAPSNKNDLFENNKFEVLNFEITANGTSVKIKDYIDQHLSKAGKPELLSLQKHKKFLQELAGLSNVALERLFNEHLDACHYRLDAWILGLANYRLDQIRRKSPKGIYIGAYGYLEHLRPNPAFSGVCITEVDTPAMVATGSGKAFYPVFPIHKLEGLGISIENLAARTYVYLGGEGTNSRIGYDPYSGIIAVNPIEDENNKGFVPAPSLTHAISGAIMRNAYFSQKGIGLADDTFALNLSSSRVREAMYFLEGLERGQELGALLGYKFERRIREQDITIAMFIYEFRQAYPFKVQHMDKPFQNGGTDELDSRIVVNGKKLVEAHRNGTLTGLLGKFKQKKNGNDEPLPIALTANQEAIILEAVIQLETILDAINDLLMAESIYQIAAGNPDRSRTALKMLNDGGNIQMPEIVNIPRSGYSLTHRVGVMLPSLGSPVEWPGFLSPRSTMETRINRYLRTKLPDPSKIMIRVRWKAGTIEGNGEPVYQWDNVPLAKLRIQPIDLMYMYYYQQNTGQENELRYRVDAYVRNIHHLEDDQWIEIMEKDRTGFKSDEIHLFALHPLLLGLAEMILNARYMTPKDLMLPADNNLQQAREKIDWEELRGRVDTVLTLVNNEFKRLSERMEILKAFSEWSEAAIQEDIAKVRLLLNRLRETLLFFHGLGMGNALPPLDHRINKNNLERMYYQSRSTAREVVNRLQALEKLGIISEEDLKDSQTGKKRALELMDIRKFVTDPLKQFYSSAFKEMDEEALVKLLIEIGQLLVGKSFTIFPHFVVYNTMEFENARTHEGLLAAAGDFAVEEWLQSLAPVRPRMHLYSRVNMLTEMVDARGAGQFLHPIQLPYHEEGYDRWLGMDYPEDYEWVDPVTNKSKIEEDTLSLVLEFSDPFKISSKYSGFIFDEWNELIPEKQVKAGISMHYDQPNTEAPNGILLAMTSQENKGWEVEEIFDTVASTITLAKKRAVDPDIIKTSELSQFLPAVLAAINVKQSTPSLDLGRAIKSVQLGADGIVKSKFTEKVATGFNNFDVTALGIEEMIIEEDL